MSNAQHTIEATLLEQSSGLRALARGLLGDEHSAEDVVQDTWLKVLRVSSAHDAIKNPVGWLRRVTSRASSNMRRAENRRGEHERIAARDESLVSVDEVVAEREVMRCVLDAVLALDEPYQGVVLMRYYKDMTPRSIAKSRGIPVATVHSQLHRARVMLRECLDDVHGGERRAWAGALAGALGTDASAMAWLVPLGTGLAAAGLVGVITIAYAFGGSASADSPGGEDRELALAVDDDEPVVIDDIDDAQKSRDDGERTPVPAIAAAQYAPALVPPPNVFELTVEVTDSSDTPSYGAQILLAPVGHPLNVVDHTRANGLSVLRWRARTASMEVDLGVRVNGRLDGGLRRVRLHVGSPQHIRLGTGHLELRAVPAEPVVGRVDRIRLGGRRREWLRSEPANGLLDDLEWVRRDESGLLQFSWPARLEVVLIDEEIEDHSEADFDSFEKKTEMAHLRGRVHTAAGQPASGALILVGTDGHRQLVHAGAEGEFDIELEPEGVIELRAGGGSLGLATHVIEFAEEKPELEHTWNPVLDRGNEVSGRLLNVEENERWLIDCVVSTPRGAHVDLTEAREGSFAIPNLAAGSASLELFQPTSWPFPVLTESITSPSTFGLELDVEKITPGGRVELSVLTSGGKPQTHADVRLMQLDTGRSAWLEYDRELERYARADVPPGRYRLSASYMLSGYTDLGDVLIESEETHAAGVANLVEPGRVEVVLARGEGESYDWTLLHRGPAVDSEVDTWSDDPLFVAPGKYLVVLRTGENRTAIARELVVNSGEDQRVEIDPADFGTLVLPSALASEGAVPFEVRRAGNGESMYASVTEAGVDLELLLIAGEYRVKVGESEHDVKVIGGETLRVGE